MNGSADTVLLRLAAAPRLCLPGRPPLTLPDLDGALLAWLAVEGATPRERLAALLWPESAADAARNALRQRLFRLRRLAGRDLVTGSAQLALAPGVAHDLAGGAESVLGTLQLPGLAEFEAWLEQQRARGQGERRRQLEARIERLESDGDLAAALPLARQLVLDEPHSEDAHRRLMRLHYLRGDRAAALLAFDRCEAVLKDEVGARPGEATLALLQIIEASAPPAAPTAAAQVPVSLLRPPQLVGRDDELALLRRARDVGDIALVIGEAGIGKSRLLQTVAASRTALASARPGDALVPYASLARLLATLLARSPAAFDAELRRRLAPVLPALAPQAPATPDRSALDRPLAALLQRLTGELDGIVLDDLHFADTASVELLHGVLAAPREARRGPPWCMGLRPPEAGSAQQKLLVALASTGPCATVQLQPLSVAAVARLVDTLRLPGVDGATLAPALRRHSGGNPLFVLESLKMAWSQGALQPGAAPATTLPAPRTLSQLIGQQLARLSPGAMMLARLAAVAGPDFSLPLAEQVLAQSALALADPWHELEAGRVLVGLGFAHDLIHEAVLAGVPALIARHLHGQVAQRLEAAQGEPARIAAHWIAAGERERALPGLRAAAQRAHAALRETEHIDFLLRAADIAEDSGRLDDAFDCVAAAVNSHMNTIRQASGYPLLDRLDRLARSPAQQALAWGSRAWYSAQLADVDTAIRFGQRAFALASTLPDQRLAAMVRQRLGAALGAAGRLDEGLTQMQAALPMLASSPHADERAEFHGNVAVLFDNVGLFDDAARHRQQAIDATRELGDHAHQVGLWANHAASRLRVGDVADASDAVQQAGRLIAAYELRGSTVGFVAVLRVQVARAEGRYDEAFAAAEDARRELQASNPTRLPVVALYEGLVWLDLGQPARARQAWLGCEDALPPHLEARRQLLLARVARLLGLDTAAHGAAARHAAPAQGWPEVSLLVQIEQAAGDEDDRALAELQARALADGLPGAALAAWLRRRDVDAAHDAAAMLARAGRYAAPLDYRAAAWHQAARLLDAAGDRIRAGQASADGRRWVEAAEAHVAPALRDGFRRRNPVNATLLGLA